MSRSTRAHDLNRLPGGDAAVLVLDEHGNITICTPGVTELTGYRAEDICGRPMADLLAESGGGASTPHDGRAALRRRGGAPVEVRLAEFPLSSAGTATGAASLVNIAPASAAERQEEDQALVRALFAQTRYDLAIHNAGLRTTRLSRTPTSLLVPQDAAAFDEQLRQVAVTGDPLIDWEHTARLRDAPETERVVSLSAFRLQDSHDHVIGVATVSTDVTDHYLARRRRALLHAASERIGRSLDVTSNAEELVQILVPDFADFASVDLTETVLTGGEPGDFRTGAPLRRVAAASSDGRWPDEAHAVGDTFRSKNAESTYLRRGMVGTAIDLSALRARLAGDPERSRLMLIDAATSMMVLPLRARGLVLGAVGMWRTAGRTAFTQDDATLAEEIGTRAALSVDNARRYTREHRSVETLQRSLLPQSVVEVSAAEAAGTYVAAGTAEGTGGSWYDVIPLSATRVAFVVGDVAGHGLNATATMGRLRTAVQTLADLDLAPEELLTHLDDLAIRLADAEPRTGGSGDGEENRPASAVVGATCLYCVYDPVTGRCVMASAGRQPPVVVRPGASADFVPLKPGPPLGMGGKPFEPVELRLEADSLLAFCPDELIAHVGDGERRLDQLCAQVSAAAQKHRSPAAIGRDVLDHLLPEEPPANEVALLIARVRALPDGSTVAWEFPADPAVVSEARERVNAQLTAWGLEDMAFTSELIVSELVTNSIRHAIGPIGLRLIKDETLICEVSDPSQTQPHVRRARLTDEGGRGLFLVAQLAHRWGSRYTSRGKTIWTEQLLNPT